MHLFERGTQKILDGSASPSAPSSLDPLMSDVRAVIGDAEALLKATAEQGGDEMDDLRAKARESLRTLNVRLMDAQKAIFAQTKRAAQVTDRYVHDSPWTSIGVGAGLGVLVGLLLRRR